MSSLGETPFAPTSDAPLYQQLYTHMRAAILRGELKGGTKLPSTRALAFEFNISRNTVLNAYRQLTAEGYLESVEGSGSFVVHVLPDLLLTPSDLHAPAADNRGVESRQAILSVHAKLQLASSQTPDALFTAPLQLRDPRFGCFSLRYLVTLHCSPGEAHEGQYV